MYHIFFIHSSVDGHLRCFHVLAIVNSAAMNTGVHVSFQTMFFSEVYFTYGSPRNSVKTQPPHCASCRACNMSAGAQAISLSSTEGQGHVLPSQPPPHRTDITGHSGRAVLVLGFWAHL